MYPGKRKTSKPTYSPEVARLIGGRDFQVPNIASLDLGLPDLNPSVQGPKTSRRNEDGVQKGASHNGSITTPRKPVWRNVGPSKSLPTTGGSISPSKSTPEKIFPSSPVSPSMLPANSLGTSRSYHSSTSDSAVLIDPSSSQAGPSPVHLELNLPNDLTSDSVAENESPRNGPGKAGSSPKMSTSPRLTPRKPSFGNKGFNLAQMTTPRNLDKVIKYHESERRAKQISLPTTKPVLPEIREKTSSKLGQYEKILMGCLEDLPPQRSNIVRIFLSSTFTDFKFERNTLAKQAYPQLKEFCAAHDLDLQVVDLRWGITEDAVNDHQVAEICLEEVATCKRLSQGPNFVAMVGNRYGFQPIPAEIEAEEFELLADIAQELELEHRELLSVWYERDDNAQPSVYVLQRVDSILKHFTDHNPSNADEQTAAVRQWNETQRLLRQVIWRCADVAVERSQMTLERRHQYNMSVTEQEISKGILETKHAKTSSICFIRDLTGLADSLDDPQARRSVDVCYTPQGLQLDENSQALLKTLVSESLPKKLSKNNLHVNAICWHPGGIDPENRQDHEQYVDSFCHLFVENVKRLVLEYKMKEKEEIIKQSTNIIRIKHQSKNKKRRSDQTSQSLNMMQGSKVDFLLGHMAVKNIMQTHEWAEDGADTQAVIDTSRVSLNREILHHLTFCKQKCEVFCGREQELATVKNFLKTKGVKTTPLLVEAPSGGGKTAFMAMLAKKSKDWLGHGCVTVVRFLGTSPESTSIKQVLVGICKQLCAAYGEMLDVRSLRKMSKLVKYFEMLLLMISIKQGISKPLVILLDSIDQLSDGDGAHTLSWLPKALPVSVYMIVSAVPTANPRLQKACLTVGNKGSLIQLADVSSDVATSIVLAFMKSKGRTLTENQLRFVIDRVSANLSPLYVKLVLDVASQWRSSTIASSLQLTPTVKSAIKAIFEKTERKFGELFVRASLGYLTVGNGGLSELELEDALSCNDMVLNEVYKFHNPPVEGVVRIPPLMWARVRHHLREYLVERQVHGKTTIFWYHRQLKETAEDMFASSPVRSSLHSDLADIYLADDEVCRDISLEHRGLEIELANRQVTVQPLTLSNVRKLTSLPYHLLYAERTKDLKTYCFCNLKYIQYFSEAFSLDDLRQELSKSIKITCDDDLSNLHDCLRFSAEQIGDDNKALAVQILGQLLGHTLESGAIAQLCSQARGFLEGQHEPTFVPVIGSVPSSSNMFKWYSGNSFEVLAKSEDRNFLLVQRSEVDGTGSLPSCRIVSLRDYCIGNPLQMRHNARNDVIVQCVFNHSSTKLFMLCRETFRVFTVPSGELEQTSSNDVARGGLLNSCIAVAPSEPYLLLAGVDRLSSFENKATTEIESSYKVRCAMNFNGAMATTNLMFSKDERKSISTHTIRGQKKVFGALVLWDFCNKVMETRVPLPSAVNRGFLHSLPSIAGHDIVLCGCDTGQIFFVDINIGKIIVEMGEELPTASTFLAIQDPGTMTLVTAAEGQNELKVCNTEVGNAGMVRTISTNTPATAIAFINDGKHVAIGNHEGVLSLYTVEQGNLTGSITAHQGSVDFVSVDDCDQVVTRGQDNLVKVWDLQSLTEADEGHQDESTSVLQSSRPTSNQSNVINIPTGDGFHQVDTKDEHGHDPGEAEQDFEKNTAGTPEAPKALSSGETNTENSLDFENVKTFSWNKPSSTPSTNDVERVFVTSGGDDGEESDESGKLLITVSKEATKLWYVDSNGCNFKTRFGIDEEVATAAFVANSTMVIAITATSRELHFFNPDTGDPLPSSDPLPPGIYLDFATCDSTESGVFLVKSPTANTVSIFRCDFISRQFERLAKNVSGLLHMVPGTSQLIQSGKYLVLGVNTTPDCDSENKSFAIKAIDLNSGRVISCKHEVSHQGPGLIEDTVAYSIAKLNDTSVICGCLGEALVWKPPKELCLRDRKDNDFVWLKHSSRLHMKEKFAGPPDVSPITAVAISKGSSWLATGAEDGSLISWKNDPAGELHADHTKLLKGHVSMVTGAAYHPNGDLLVTAGQDRTVRLFDLRASPPKQVAMVDTHLPVEHLQLNAEGTMVCALAKDSSLSRIMIFQLSNLHLLNAEQSYKETDETKD